MHKFLSVKEELMRAEQEQLADKVLEAMEKKLKSSFDEISSIEGSLSNLQAKEDLQEDPKLLKDVDVLLNRCETEAQNFEDVLTELAVNIFGGPFQYVKYVEGNESSYFTSLSLDPETENEQLILSQDLRSVRIGNKKHDLPDQLERFVKSLYVLTSMCFTSGIHYWEVGLGNKTLWIVGVCRESVNRKEDIIPSPENGYWVIGQLPEYKSLKIPDVISHLKVKPRKLGVYLDYEGGQVSFYDAEDRSHLYTFTDTFNEKLHPIFNPFNYKTGANSEPLTLLTS